jgi:small-conductance mechanosensitive channel
VSPNHTQSAAAAAGVGCSPLASVDGDFKQAMLQQLHGHQQHLQEESPDFFTLLQQRERARSAAGAAAAEIAAAVGDVRDSEGAEQQQQPQQGDWDEFIERQGLFLLIKEAKRAQIAAELARKKQPEVSRR